MPSPTGGAGYSIVGQNIYLAGTWNNAAGSTQHYRYDIVADSWTSVAPVPVNIYRPDSASIGTDTYLVGGGNPSLGPKVSPQARKLASTRAPMVSYNSTYIYDTVADSWTTGPNTNVAHSFTGGTAIGTKLIVVTGFDGVSGDTNIVELADSGGGVGNCSDYTFAYGLARSRRAYDLNRLRRLHHPITLPFPVSVYGTTFTSVLVESNGTLQFTGNTAFFNSGCNPLPNATMATLFPYYDDLSTDFWDRQTAFLPADAASSRRLRGLAQPGLLHRMAHRLFW